MGLQRVGCQKGNVDAVIDGLVVNFFSYRLGKLSVADGRSDARNVIKKNLGLSLELAGNGS